MPSALSLAIDAGMIRFLIIFLVVSAAAFAVEIPDTLVVDGQTYKGVVYQSHDASRLRVMHETGVGAFPIASLPTGIQRSLGYDPEAAKAAMAAEAERAAEAAEAKQAAEAAEGPRIKELKAQAASGDADAAYFLGERYQSGQEVEASLGQAVQWFYTAANLGHRKACYSLGKCYEYGEGVGQSFQMALEWYRKAAQRGDGRGYDRIRDAVSDGKVSQSYLNGLVDTHREMTKYRTFDSAAEREAWTTKVKLKELDANQRRIDRAIDYVTGSEQERAAIRGSGGITNRHGNRID